MKLGSGGTGRIPRLVLLLVALVLVVPPVATVVLGSFRDGRTLGTGTFTLENFSSILSNRDLIEALGWTLAFALATSVLTIALAVVVAWVSERTNAPGRSLVNVTLVAAFAVPHFVIAMGWLLVLGPNTGLVNYWLTKVFGAGATQFDLFTFKGMVIVETFSLLPLLVLLIRPSFRAMNPELEEAAKIFGADERTTLRKITVPMARPAILAAGFLCLVLTVQAFEVPTLIGVRSRISVLSVEIYREVNGPIPNYGIASAFSVSLIVLTLAGLTFYRRSTRHADRFAQMTGKAYRARRIDLGAWKWLAALVNVGMFVITLAPIAILAWASLFERYMGPSPADNPLTLTMYRQVLEDPIAIDAAVNTFLLGLAGAAIVVGFTLVAAWFVLRRPGAITGAADHVITVPLVLPGIVLALALISIFLSLPVPLYGTYVVILVAFVLNYLPYGMRFNVAGLSSVHRELEEAAATSGSRQFTTFRKIVVPLMLPSIIAGGLFILLGSFRQLSLVVLLAGPGNELVAPHLFDMWELGSISLAAAYALLIVSVALVVLGIALGINRLRRRGATAEPATTEPIV